MKSIFIQNLRTARLRKQLSQAKLAEMIDLSTGFIGDLETGRTSPSFQTIEALAEALEIEPFMLFVPPDRFNTFQELQVDTIVEEVRELLHRFSVGPRTMQQDGKSDE